MTTFSVIGPGKLGTSLLIRLNQFTKPIFYHRRPDQVAAKLGQSVTLEEAAQADIVFLTVKPSSIKDLCRELKGKIGHNSVIAGVSKAFLCRSLETDNVIRAMFSLAIGYVNFPVTIHLFGSSPDLEPLGNIVYASNEDYIDQVTAKYACGLGFILRFYQAYRSICTDQQCLDELFLSVPQMIGVSDDPIADVACKGGATERGLKHLTDLESMIGRAVQSAQDRCTEIKNSYI